MKINIIRVNEDEWLKYYTKLRTKEKEMEGDSKISKERMKKGEKIEVWTI